MGLFLSVHPMRVSQLLLKMLITEEAVLNLSCYDNAIPDERIEKPVGLSVAEKEIGNYPRCEDCMAKGCGETGNIMCSECGGRGYL